MATDDGKTWSAESRTYAKPLAGQSIRRGVARSAHCLPGRSVVIGMTDSAKLARSDATAIPSS
jgi:hypothetical protein